MRGGSQQLKIGSQREFCPAKRSAGESRVRSRTKGGFALDSLHHRSQKPPDMSCTCRTLVSTARQAAAQAARSRVALPVRSFTTSSLRAAAAQVDTKGAAGARASTHDDQDSGEARLTTLTSSAAATAVSSCPAGTVLKGLNYLKDASDPVAMEDSEYPAWVWQLGQPDAPIKGKKVDVETRLRAEKKALKRQRKVAIKARNALNG